jgi:hypothetical protein
MFEILAINKRTFKTESLGFASNYTELQLIVTQEKPNYQAVWFVRRNNR